MKQLTLKPVLASFAALTPLFLALTLLAGMAGGAGAQTPLPPHIRANGASENNVNGDPNAYIDGTSPYDQSQANANGIWNLVTSNGRSYYIRGTAPSATVGPGYTITQKSTPGTWAFERYMHQDTGLNADKSPYELEDYHSATSDPTSAYTAGDGNPSASPTVVAASPAISITAGDYLPPLYFSAVAPSDPRIRLTGGTIANGGNYPNPSIVGGSGSACLDFVFNGDEIDVSVINTGGSFRIFADGVEITDGVSAASTYTAPHLYSVSNDGNYSTIKISLLSAQSRHIRIEAQGLGVRGIYFNTTFYTISPAGGLINGLVPNGPGFNAGPKVVVMGDSYTEGTGTDGPLDAWETILFRSLNCYNIVPSGLGGTGYLNPGPSGSGRVTFSDRFDADIVPNNPDVLVFAGGINDNPDNNPAWTHALLQSTAIALYQHAKATCPNAKIYVLGPWQPGATHNYPPLLGVRADLMAAAAAVPGVKFIDVQPFFTGTGNISNPVGDGNSDIYIGPDNTHPTPAGHAYIAAQLKPLMSELQYTPPLAVIGTVSQNPNTGVLITGIPTNGSGPFTYTLTRPGMTPITNTTGILADPSPVIGILNLYTLSVTDSEATPVTQTLTQAVVPLGTFTAPTLPLVPTRQPSRGR